MTQYTNVDAGYHGRLVNCCMSVFGLPCVKARMKAGWVLPAEHWDEAPSVEDAGALLFRAMITHMNVRWSPCPLLTLSLCHFLSSRARATFTEESAERDRERGRKGGINLTICFSFYECACRDSRKRHKKRAQQGGRRTSGEETETVTRLGLASK